MSTIGPMNAQKMRDQGWFLYRPRQIAQDAPRIREEGRHPAVMVARIREEVCGDIQLRHHRRGAGQPHGIVKYVFESIFRPLYMHPLSALLTAIEDEVHSKIFVRPSRLLPADIDALTKFFPFHGAPVQRSRPPQIAFYGILHRLLDEKLARTYNLLCHELAIAHEAWHHYLHLAPWLLAESRKDESLRAIWDQYDLMLKQGEEIHFGPPAEIAEFEAELGGFLSLVGKGYLTIRARRPDEILGLYDKALLGFEPEQLVEAIEECSESVPRPASIEDVRLWGSDSLTTAKPPLNPDVAMEDRLEAITEKARFIVRESRARPYAWLYRAIEDRFLPEMNEQKHNYNVLIRLASAEVSQSVCSVERRFLPSPFPEVNEKLANHPPHLIRYTISYPHSWDILRNPKHRLDVLRWLGLIDLGEVRQKDPPGFTKEQASATRALEDYDDTTRNLALLYAVAVDCLAGDQTEWKQYDPRAARSILAESPLDLDVLRKSPHVGVYLEEHLGPAIPERLKKQSIPPSDMESDDATLVVTAILDECVQVQYLPTGEIGQVDSRVFSRQTPQLGDLFRCPRIAPDKVRPETLRRVNEDERREILDGLQSLVGLIGLANRDLASRRDYPYVAEMAKLDGEFRQLRPELGREHRGPFVAFTSGRVIAEGDDEIELARQVYRNDYPLTIIRNLAAKEEDQVPDYFDSPEIEL